MPARETLLIPTFEVGRNYSRRDDIHQVYGDSRQSGISSSAECPAIFIFTGESGGQYGYEDGFDQAGVFSYSGEGQVGDMTFTAGNKAIRDHAKNGRALHLFRALGKSKPCKYLGEFVLANYFTRRGPDRNGKDREIIVFHLLRAEASTSPMDLLSLDERPKQDLAEARARAIEACNAERGGAGRYALKALYERSRAIRDYVIQRANGHCEGCGAPSPFMGLDQLPYFEAHHTTRLSDGGVDHPSHVAALCPTCHRRVHYGKDGRDLNEMIIRRLREIEPAKCLVCRAVRSTLPVSRA